MLQGEIWWANLPEPDGRRPVVILTRSSAIPKLNRVTIAGATTTIRGIPTEVALSATGDDMPTDCVVSLDAIFTIRKSILDDRITRLSDAKLEEIFGAIHVAFDMHF